MKKLLVILGMMFLFVFISWSANASLTTIGKAAYNGSDYNLIWDNDYNGQSLVWLDYSNAQDTWQNQTDWVSGLGSQLTIALSSGYSSTIDWSTGWRLPSAGSNPVSGYDNTSEMGHIYYSELGLESWYDRGYVLATNEELNETNFDTLNAAEYWTGTEWSGDPTFTAWNFNFSKGNRNAAVKYDNLHLGYGLAVHSGDVSAVPIPGAVWLLGSGLIGIVGIRRKIKK